MPRQPSLLPSFTIDLAGQRRAVESVDRDATVADLLAAAAESGRIATHGEIAIDGRRVPADTRLAVSGIRHGSVVGEGVDPAGPVSRARFVGTWVSGPDAGGVAALAAGRHHIGRSRHAAVRCDDPDLEPHHALLEVTPEGCATVHHLSGRRPLLIDGAPVEGSAAVTAGARIEIGGSVLRISAAPLEDAPLPLDAARNLPAAVDPGDPWRRPHARVPRAQVSFAPEPIAVPRNSDHARGGAGGTLWPTILGVAGAGVLALLLGQVMFLMFGLMGGVVGFGTWLAQRVGLVRSRGRAQASRAAAMAAFTETLAGQRAAALAAIDANVPTIARAIAMLHRVDRELWGVRDVDPHAFTVSIGEGEGSWRPDVTGTGDASPEVWAEIEAASRLGTTPVGVRLAAGSVIAIAGGDAAERAAVARAMVVQLAAASGPADWQLGIVADADRGWPELDWLAHRVVDPSGGRSSEVVIAMLDGSLDTADERHIVLLVDRPEHLRARTSPVRRLMARAPSLACIVLCASEAEVPAVSTSMLVLGRRGAGRWIADTTAGALAEPVRFAGIAADRAERAARCIAHLTDPELTVAGAGVPTDLGLMDLMRDEIGVEPDRMAHCIADLWRGRGVDPQPSAPIGIAADGVVEIDLSRDGPHGLIAGTTGSGKSELLRSLVLGLAARSRPELLSFVLVDYKGGATFDGVAALPHVVGMVTDLDDRLAARALRSLEAELRRRERVLREAGVSDLGAHRQAVDAGRTSEHLARLVVIIDEFAGLAVQQPGFLGALVGIAQRGRSLGVHLVLATQRPAGVVSDDIRANTQLRLALRVHDTADALDVIGAPDAARLSRGVPGRAMMRLGAEEIVTFQTACCSRPATRARPATPLVLRDPRAVVPAPDSDASSAVTEMEVLVAAIRRAAELTGSAAPHRPWLPPLAESEVPDVTAEVTGAVGVIDDPDGQCRLPLLVPEAGHLAIAGSVGAGATTALLAVAAHATGRGVELHVLDALGDPRIGTLTGRANIVRLHERERVVRLLDHLSAVIARRSTGGGAPDQGEVMLCIDGFGALRAALERDDEWGRLEQLEHIIAGGVAAGVRVVLTVTRAGAIPSAALTHIAHRWVLHLAEPLDAAVLGVAPDHVPAAVPGRLIVAASGLEAQLFTGAPAIALQSCAAPRVIGALATEVSLAALPVAVVSGGDVLAPIGIDFQTLAPAVLPMIAGEHVLVAGPARSGCSTALRTIAVCWMRAVPTGRVLCLAGRRSSARVGDVCETISDLVGMLEAPGARHAPSTLVVVDDAELVDDPSGRLGALLAMRPEHVTVVAAGRPEALRGSYGHWTGGVRRSRLGLLLTGCTDLDADLLGAVLPRRAPLAPRPGLAWMVAEGAQRLVQVAHEPVESVDREVPGRNGAPATVSLDAVGVLP